MKKIVKLALIAGGVAAVAKVVAAKKSEWLGLTEQEVRARIDARLRDRIPEEKRADVTDKVVSKMRERGLLAEDTGSSEPTEDAGAGEEGDSGEAAKPAGMES